MNQKSFTDMLRERRAFVSGQKQPYGMGGGDPTSDPGMMLAALQSYINKRAGVMNQVEPQVQGLVRNQIDNGSNGVPIDPVAAKGDLYNFYDKNQNRMDSLMGILQGANNSVMQDKRTGEQLGIDQQKANNEYNLGAGDLGLKAKELGLQYGLSDSGKGDGYDPSRVKSIADQIQQGYTDPSSIGKLPPGLQGAVQDELGKRGFQPGAPDATTRTQVEGLTNILGQLKDDAKNIGLLDIFSSKLPDSKMSKFDARKNIATQLMARLFEKGNMSDSDRKFYMDQVASISPFGDTNSKNAKIDQLINDVKTMKGYDKIGSSSASGKTPKNVDPLGILK